MVLNDPMRNERYDREVGRTIEIADKVTRDAGESLDAGVITQETHDRICAMAREYADSTIALVRHLYFGTEPTDDRWVTQNSGPDFREP